MNRIGRKVKVIAKSSRHKKDLTAKVGVMTLTISAMLALSGCMGSMDMFGGGVDKSISTSTVTNQKNPETVSEEMTVSNAVTSADVTKLDGKPLPWANASTGSAGVITAIAEQTGGASVCRTFQTTRHSYRGIANFSGQTCLRDDGRWQLLSFQEAQ